MLINLEAHRRAMTNPTLTHDIELVEQCGDQCDSVQVSAIDESQRFSVPQLSPLNQCVTRSQVHETFRTTDLLTLLESIDDAAQPALRREIDALCAESPSFENLPMVYGAPVPIADLFHSHAHAMRRQHAGCALYSDVIAMTLQIGRAWYVLL